MELFNNWRLLVLIYIVTVGIWGFLVKVSSTHLNSFTFAFISLTSAWVTVSFISYSKLNWQSGPGVPLAAVCGILGGLCSIIFYYLLKRAPANVIIPLSSLYILITVVLSYFFLNETLGYKKVIGIIFGLAAIILLTL